jgi:nucleotide-binding universal stress UspA family protein
MLIATDGSDFSCKAAFHGLALAKALGASVTVLTVNLPWNAIALSEIARGFDAKDYEARVNKQGDKCLAPIAEKAAAQGVPCQVVQIMHEYPYQGIMQVARDKGCDAIVVGAHGRRGLSGLLIGSETAKLLTHANVPVVVYRE